MTSARRGITPARLKPVLERASGMRVFETDEMVAALEARGFTGVHQRLAGLTQFVGGRHLLEDQAVVPGANASMIRRW